MDIEKVAKQMRERALLMEGNPHLTLKDLQGRKLKKEKELQHTRLESYKKLYFNAGRWAGGARDHLARQAFEHVNGRIKSGPEEIHNP
jgi:hypothetical protein